MKNYSLKLKINLKILFVFFLIVTFNFALLTFNLRPAEAQTMSSDKFILRYSGLNQAAGVSKNNSNTLEVNLKGDTLTQPGSGKTYNVQAQPGEALPTSSGSITFSVSELFIDFGTLSPTNPVTRTHIVTLRGAVPFSVFTYLDHNLQSDAKNTIPNTTCDSGTCTPASAGTWASTLTYGFGYRCDNITGVLCDTDFTSPSFFKPFPAGASALPQITLRMDGNQEKKAQVTYKVNVSQTQPQEAYKTIVHIIAAPNY